MFSSCGESWNEGNHKSDYTKAMSDFQIDPDDGWGMRRLQAYSSCTSIIMCGPYKGYPQNMQAAALSLKLESANSNS